MALVAGLALAGCGNDSSYSSGSGSGSASEATPPAAAPRGPAATALAGKAWVGGDALDLVATAGKVRAVAFFKPG
jgi:hypothetical protein